MSSFAKVSAESDVDPPYAVVNEKKLKRKISNRVSARRSRMKRQKHLEDLVNGKAVLENKIIEDNQKFTAAWQNHFSLELQNKALRAENMKLAKYLQPLQQILENHKQNESCLNLEVSELFSNPWQVHGPV